MREVIHRDNPCLALRVQRPDQIGTNESGRAGDNNVIWHSVLLDP
jgi:hypothetical protein